LRGKIFLDYVHIVTRLPELVEACTLDAIPDAVVASEVEDLTRGIPKIIGILPDVLCKKDDPRHKAALAAMTGSLLRLLDRANPMALPHVHPMLVDEKTKLAHVRSTAYARFMNSL